MSKSFVKALLSSAVLLVTAASALAAEAETAVKEMVIYDTALAPGWENRSSAKAELGIELTGSPRRPIAVQAAPGTGLQLQHEPFSTEGFEAVEFLIQGTAPSSDVRLVALAGGKPLGEGVAITMTNKGWTRVVRSLADLGAENMQIDGIALQNASGAELPKFVVTDIKLK